jgi:hypothetical protein
VSILTETQFFRRLNAMVRLPLSEPLSMRVQMMMAVRIGLTTAFMLRSRRRRNRSPLLQGQDHHGAHHSSPPHPVGSRAADLVALRSSRKELSKRYPNSARIPLWKKFGLRKEHRRLQGLIYGKRCGVTENIGEAARDRWRGNKIAATMQER